MNNRNNHLLALLGGAAAGALAMYLTDPEAGARRREAIGEVAGGALRGTGEHLGSAFERLSEHAKNIGQHLGAAAAAAGTGVAARLSDLHVGDTVSQAASRGTSYVEELGKSLMDRVHGLGGKISDSASDAHASLAEHSHAAGDSLRSLLGRRRHSFYDDHEVSVHVVSVAATLALGAGAMYFLDPERGRSRRAWAGQKAGKVVNETGKAFNQLGKRCHHLVNRTYGVAHDIQNSPMMEQSVATVEQLTARVRAAIGKVVTRADLVQVMAKAQGVVELTGRVVASEADALLQAVKRVFGVQQVVNRMDVVDRVDQPGSMNAGTAQ